MEIFSTFIVRPDDEAAFLPLLPEGYEKRKKNTFLLGAASKEGQACGVIWIEREGIRLRVLHIAVAEEYRRRGIASQLLDDLFAAVCRLKQQVPITASFCRTEENEAVYRLLFQRREVVTGLDRSIFHISSVCRENSSYYQKMCGGTIRAVPYFELSKEDRRQFLYGLSKAERAILEEIPEEAFCQKLCFVCGIKGEIRSAVFFTHTGTRTIELSYLYIQQGQKAQQDLLCLLQSAAVVMEREYTEYDLNIFAQDLKIRRMIHRIFPTGIKGIDWIRADWIMTRV